MTLSTYAGVLAGLLFSSGILLLSSFGRRRRFTLEDRLEPYLVEQESTSRFLGFRKVSSPLGVWAKALEPVATAFDNVLTVFSSPGEQLRKRLHRAGRRQTVHEYRLEQLQFAIVGLIISLILTIALAVFRDFSFAVSIVVLALGPTVFLGLCDYKLSMDITQRTERILTEFPTLAELLALAVASGEGPLAALERVSKTGNGALAEELSTVIAGVRAGKPLAQALEELGHRTGIDAIVRFSDGVAIAVERGTPLAQVLRAQAQDARDLGHRELMELGGKKEVTMLIPVVFFILPITVVFAVFPSISVLNFGL